MDNLKKQFSDLYDQYIDKIYRFVLIKVNSQEVAEDLTAEAFLKIWEALKKRSNPHPRTIDNPSAFLYKIARNLVIDYYREKGRSQSIPVEDVQIADVGSNPEQQAIMVSDLELTKRAMAALRDEYREVITWYYLDELNVSEIARTLNKSEGNVRVLIHRALNSLREKLEGKVEEA